MASPEAPSKDGERVRKLGASFVTALNEAVKGFDKQAVVEAFKEVRPEYHPVLYDLVQQVIGIVCRNSRQEFDDICLETRIYDHLNVLDRLCEEQGLSATAPSPTRRPVPDPNSPAMLVAAEVNAAAENERAELARLLEEAEQERNRLQGLLEVRRQETDAVAAEMAAVSDELSKVHKQSVMWASRSIRRREAQQPSR